MKRQSVGHRKASEESQSQVNENKRLKSFHEPEYSIVDMEAGSGSDTTEECISINTNGQDENFEPAVNPEEDFPNSGNMSQNHGYTNGTYANVDNYSAEAVPANNMNGTRVESHVTNEGNNENIEPNHSNYQSDNFQNNLLAEAGEPFQDERSSTPPMPSLTPNQDLSSTQTEINPLISADVQNCNLDSSPGPSSSQDQVDAVQNTESDPAKDRAGPSSSSQAESGDQVDNACLSLSKGKVDIENITLCQLKVTQLEGHADVIFSVAADDDFILSSSGDTTVKVWNVDKATEVSNFAGHSAAVTSVILLSAEQSEALRSKLNCFQTSRIAVSASFDCHIRLWSVEDGHEILSMYTFNSITCMAFLENHMYVVVGTEGGKLEVWDLHLAKQVHFVFAHDSSVTNLKVHDCYIYSTSKDGAVKVWLFDEGELQPLYTRRRKETSLTSPHFGPTQWQAVDVHKDTLYLGDNSCRMKALDWRLGRMQLYVNQPDDHGICEAILAQNNILLSTFFNSASDTGGINVWHLPELSYVGTLTGDLQEIISLAMIQSKDKLRIVSGGHQLLVWDFDFSKPPIKTAQDPFFVCEVDKVGSQVNEDSVETDAKKRLQSASNESVESKRSWCNIS